jgi:rRNA maturation protein Rpf1
VNREVKLEELYGKVLSFVIKDNKFITGVKKKTWDLKERAKEAITERIINVNDTLDK